MWCLHNLVFSVSIGWVSLAGSLLLLSMSLLVFLVLCVVDCGRGHIRFFSCPPDACMALAWVAGVGMAVVVVLAVAMVVDVPMGVMRIVAAVVPVVVAVVMVVPAVVAVVVVCRWALASAGCVVSVWEARAFLVLAAVVVLAVSIAGGGGG